MRKVRAGSKYVYSPVLIDKIDGRTGLVEGDVVQVVNLRGCPPANTMGHCHVNAVASVHCENGKFAGLVCCNSLVPLKEWVASGQPTSCQREAYNV